ncbi:MAG TPA: MFS transporter [Candidatus Hydrogenedentes bacterium]|mgnify:FL=1|nr:MFS transporter [Candidatus Hydrogenedentota bacterium]
MSRNEQQEFTRLEGFAFLLAVIGIQLSSELLAQWGTYFYSPTLGTGRIVYVAIGLVAIIFVTGCVFDAVTDPLVGMWSDKTAEKRVRWRVALIQGRRRPFIFWGSLGMTLTSILFWFPPLAHESVINLVYGTVVICAHWFFFTLCNIPLLALAPEVALSKQGRVRLGAWIAAGMTLGLALAIALPGPLIEILDPARVAAKAAGDAPVHSALGYQRVAILYALCSLACFQFMVFTVRERFMPEAHTPATAPFRDFRRALNNPVFRRYIVIFGFFYIGYLAVQRILPYWAEAGLGGDESTVTLLAAPFMVSCLLSALATPFFAARINLKWLAAAALGIVTVGLPFVYVIGMLPFSSDVRLRLGVVLFATVGIGQGLIYVLQTPLIGEIIDLDEQSSGKRREAIFNSVHTFMVKMAQALSIGVATGSMHFFGNSASRPTGIFLVGPLGGMLALVGLVTAFTYPILNPVRATARPERLER